MDFESLKRRFELVQENIYSVVSQLNQLDSKVENELDSLKVHVNDLGRSLTENVDTLLDEIIKKSVN